MMQEDEGQWVLHRACLLTTSTVATGATDMSDNDAREQSYVL